VTRCAGGSGPQPTGLMEAMLAWVEDGKAPETLPAVRREQTGTITRSRPLCQYPLVAKYKGSGSTDEAANFVSHPRTGPSTPRTGLSHPRTGPSHPRPVAPSDRT